MTNKNECPKCGSTNILTRFVQSGALVDSSSFVKIKNEFLCSIEDAIFYKVKSAKDHLHKHCRNCQFDWRENTLDATSDNAQRGASI